MNETTLKKMKIEFTNKLNAEWTSCLAANIWCRNFCLAVAVCKLQTAENYNYAC
jgi:hypothetical protein